jgi:ribonuclease HII
VRIDDSKRLSPRQRALAYQAILTQAIVGVGIVPADSIDADNIRQATLQAMVKAVADLSIRPELVLVDGCDVPPVNLPCRPIIGGDRSSYPIACASIIAKVTRDRLMEFYHRLFPAYRFDQHKGYGTRLHHHTLTQHGPSFLHRLTFAPVKLHGHGPWSGILSESPPSRLAKPHEGTSRRMAVSDRPSQDPHAFRSTAPRTRR